MTEPKHKRKREPPQISEAGTRRLLSDLERSRINVHLELEEAMDIMRREDLAVGQRLGMRILRQEFAAADAALKEWDAKVDFLVPDEISRQDYDNERRELSAIKDAAQNALETTTNEAQRTLAPYQQRIQAKQEAVAKADQAWETWVPFARAHRIPLDGYWTPAKGPAPRPEPAPGEASSEAAPPASGNGQEPPSTSSETAQPASQAPGASPP